ncbi:hypothetical protein [Paraburkholderia caffeinilytica]|uniref:hypothetical protein n=1 Tax=Paraburkholderia caffeinilytica TaxID=1761016 RepID=UPI003D9FC4C3
MPSEIAQRVAKAPKRRGIAVHQGPALQQIRQRNDASLFAPQIEQARAYRVDMLDRIFSLGQIGNHDDTWKQDDLHAFILSGQLLR